ncbi:unnamed protein product [Somion occarium]|uniref:non-specific serine/threonine protein kinase n=1 Tax=Somion occarium TaxID=3059160 RepID=A0ABP1CQ20_9APHY
MDSFQSNLQVPEISAGPSRSQTHNRPVSVQPTTNSTSPSASSRKRASHSVVTGQQEQEPQPTYRDVYSHPAALEYAAAHPRRTIPKFGPYLLLQTLGEGEFGKVKLGLHMQWGEEVAVKLIRRGNIDTSVRMSKVEREIEVLRMLKHPNIVRLYDVIETDKYIGIILEYASGGELFDHILAHRYLREKDACKLFSQLLSGVWYIHQKKIVHRDLKLENLLLDRNRNVIITDFGFANRFEHRADDLMQTSCGSPCYAAPELVISDGLYVGSAVDIWSCGVILYAMLAGYLPFDDDPANPDGDNINLLYKYIVNTPLSFPEYISADARELLSLMLVPDPQTRADLPTIMAHRWLAPYAHIFTKSVEDVERTAMEQHHQKRLAYQRQMRQNADQSVSRVSRRTETYSSGVSPVSPRSHRHAQPEYLYETSAEHSAYSATNSSRRGVASAIVMPTAPPVTLDDDPFAPTPTQEVAVPMVSSPPNDLGMVTEVSRDGKSERNGIKPAIQPVKTSPDHKRQKDGFRHTIQVEVPEADSQPQSSGATPTQNGTPKRTPSTRTPERNGVTPTPERKSSISAKPLPSTPSVGRKRSHEDVSTTKLLAYSPPAPEAPAPVVSIEVTSPPATPAAVDDKPSGHEQTASGSIGSGSSRRSTRHRKGLSIDKINITKIFSNGNNESQTNGKVDRAPSQRSNSGRNQSNDTITTATAKDGTIGRRPTTLQVPPSSAGAAIAVSNMETPAKSGALAPPESSKKSRRNTLTVMVEPFRKQLTRGSKTVETPVKEHPHHLEKEHTVEADREKETAVHTKDMLPPTTPTFAKTRPTIGRRSAVPASTAKASGVMNWFRSKSKGRPIVDEPVEKPLPVPQPDSSQTQLTGAASSSSSVNNAASLITPTSENRRSPMFSGHPQRSASASAHAETSFSLTDRVLGKRALPKGVIGRHHGPVDPTTITSGSPPEVMKHVIAVLESMGMEVSIETDFKYRCVRPKRKRTATGLGLKEGGSSLAAFSLMGSAASNGVDRRGLPAPSQSFGGGGMLRGLLMRRQSSQAGPATSPAIENDPEAVLAAAVPGDGKEILYGDSQQDQGDEVRFSVELTRLDRLDDTYSLDIRRLKGNLRSYKFLYDTLREYVSNCDGLDDFKMLTILVSRRADLQR